MNDNIEMYFAIRSNGDKSKVDMSRNELRDPIFESAVDELIKRVDTKKIMKYPNEVRLYQAYSEYFQIPIQNIAVGHGSDELIGRIFQLYKDKLFFIGNNEYFMAKSWADIHNIEVTTNIQEAEVVYLGNPNSNNGVNNTNRVNFLIGMGKVVICDEVYSAFTKSDSFRQQAKDNDNLWVIDSMSKSLGLCGLRAGVVFSTKSNMQSIHMIRQGLTSNSLACELMPMILNNKEEINKHITRIKDGKRYLENKYKHDESCAPYSLLKLDSLPQEFKDRVHFLEGTYNARVAGATKAFWKSIGV